MSGVTLKNIEKIYSNGFKAVHGIDLEIKSGEFMVLVGPSGCAKSTMLRMIAGLEDITRGELWIEGKLSNKLPPKDRGIAMVFQNYALYPHMTTYENMAFGLKMAKFSKKEIDKRVRETAERLEISDILDRKPKEMSGGQKQRVALGRAIVREPKVFLFDEPLSNLDAKLRVSMRVRITQLHKELLNEGKETIMIYVTHDQVEAMTMGDRICVLNKGKVIGCIARSVSRSLPKKYYHPIVRIAVIHNGMLYLMKRSKDAFVSPDTIDYPFHSYVLFRHSIESTVRESVGELAEQQDVNPRFLIRYTFENEKVKHLVSLYVICLRTEEQLSQCKRAGGKLWTAKQIEENLQSGVFSEYFEQEFSYLQNTILLAENFCCGK